MHTSHRHIYIHFLHLTITNNVQGGKLVTLFNVKQEAYLGGYGSFVNDCLPDFLKSSSAGQGKDTIIIIIILKVILFFF